MTESISDALHKESLSAFVILTCLKLSNRFLLQMNLGRRQFWIDTKSPKQVSRSADLGNAR
jgi:hypothetical protein